MIHLCTLNINKVKYGTISSYQEKSTNVRFVINKPIYIVTNHTSSISIDLIHLDNEAVDEPLRTLSSNTYIITTNNRVMIGDKMYQANGLPYAVQWKAIPVTIGNEIVPYNLVNEIDNIFLMEGYANEINKAKHILVLPDWDFISATCTPLDLLISHRSNDTYTSYSSRSITLKDTDILRTEGRYIYLSSIPTFIGTSKIPVYTYNSSILIFKYITLQNRLNAYGSNRVDSVITSMKILIDLLEDMPNQFHTASIYDDIVSLIDKIKDMN